MIPESPTWPIKIFPRLINAMLAVVPAVLGNPEAVLGHFSKNNNSNSHLIERSTVAILLEQIIYLVLST